MKINTKFVNINKDGKVTLSSDNSGVAIMGVEGYSLKAHWVRNLVKKDSALVTMRKGGKVTTPMPFPRREAGDRYAAMGWEFMVVARLGESKQWSDLAMGTWLPKSEFMKSAELFGLKGAPIGVLCGHGWSEESLMAQYMEEGLDSLSHLPGVGEGTLDKLELAILATLNSSTTTTEVISGEFVRVEPDYDMEADMQEFFEMVDAGFSPEEIEASI